MKITNSFKLIAILVVLLSSGHTYAFGQDSYIKGRWNIKAGYSQYSLGSSSNNIENMTGHYRLETNYGFFDAIETGLYFGYSEIDTYGYSETDPTWFYGLNLNLHPLDWLFDSEPPGFELYLTGRYGFRNYQGNHSEYGIGGGLAWYWGRYFGIYLEYTYGNHGAFRIYDNYMKLRYGISIRF
ncbi:MAG: hypothetical protein ACLFQA_09600 [Bacteroidales bacterium]